MSNDIHHNVRFNTSDIIADNSNSVLEDLSSEPLRIILEIASKVRNEPEMPVEQLMLSSGLTQGTAALRFLLNHINIPTNSLEACVELLVQSDDTEGLMREFITNTPNNERLHEIFHEVCKSIKPNHPLSSLVDTPKIYPVFSALFYDNRIEIDEGCSAEIDMNFEGYIISLERPLTCWSHATFVSKIAGVITVEISNNTVADDTGLLPPALLAVLR